VPILSAKSFKQLEVVSEIVGEILGLTGRRVRQLTEEGVMAKNGRGKYPVLASIKAYIKWLQAAQQRNAPSDAREAVLHERARSLRLQNDEREHRLVDTEEVIAVLDEIVGIFRSEMDGLPARLTRDLDERKIVQEAVDAIGHRAADKLEQRAAELRQNGSVAVPVDDADEV
jgi:phage terminase Nu1 subunit (DNA packaging protein)